VAQCDHRIDTHGAACRHVGSGQRNDGQHDGDDRKGCRVGRLDFEEEAGHQARESEGTGDADGDTQGCELRNIAQHKAKDVAALSAQRDVEAELVHALADAIGHHAVNSHGGKKQRERGEQPEKQHVEMLLRKRHSH